MGWFCMANVLVSLDVVHDRRLRQLAREDYQSKKGALSLIVAQGIDAVFERNERQRLVAEAIATLHEPHHSGLKPGERYYKERGELYDR